MIYVQQWVLRSQWGRDESLPNTIHKSITDLHDYIQQYWDKMPDDVPEDYAAPLGSPIAVEESILSPEFLVKLNNSKNGIQMGVLK